MKDKDFVELMVKCQKVKKAHTHLLNMCEKEYKNRFLVRPSDIDDEYWIQCLHDGKGKITIQNIVESASINKQLNK